MQNELGWKGQSDPFILGAFDFNFQLDLSHLQLCSDERWHFYSLISDHSTVCLKYFYRCGVRELGQVRKHPVIKGGEMKRKMDHFR